MLQSIIYVRIRNITNILFGYFTVFFEIDALNLYISMELVVLNINAKE